ncbi:hypothetical protein IVB69_05670 [Flavobacterium sp. J49]|uniref:hypothetical protein n=1 Tax=Flavobacterium sp. J49 TaxID=2718534 RepID=UPI0015949C85|nr:hypothetical protein [Flavobacterium sp. J49]MBF6640960.1 hypothetical protein [Flavobacterium sp. J49]NIC02207.1 hypothetical protein [Flavobacterium sp. J49]
MRKIGFIIILLLASFKFYGQEISNLDKILKEKYPQKESFIADGIWMYHPEMGNIKELSLDYVKNLTPEYKYFTVVLTNYLDRHIEDAECIILLNKKDNSILLIPPVWFSDENQEFFNLLIGHEFKDKKEIEDFVKEMERIILIGSEMHLGKTSYDENKVIIRLILNGHDDTWKTIEFNFENNKLLSTVSN